MAIELCTADLIAGTIGPKLRATLGRAAAEIDRCTDAAGAPSSMPTQTSCRIKILHLKSDQMETERNDR
jgi:hypothetical protein